MPCATQNELSGNDALALIANGCRVVAEGANMPTTPVGVRHFLDAGVSFAPGKAANAGGVATSARAMQQNASRDQWRFEHTEARLHEVMAGLHATCFATAEELPSHGHTVVGPNPPGIRPASRAQP